MVSPSSTATSRKVPCIAGCDGPMLIVMRSNIVVAAASRQVELRLVDLVLGAGSSAAPGRSPCAAGGPGRPRGEDAAQVRVAVEAEAEHVVGLALEPVGAPSTPGQRRERGVALGDAAPSGAGARRAGSSRGGRRPRSAALASSRSGIVDAADVEQQVEAGRAGRRAASRQTSASDARGRRSRSAGRCPSCGVTLPVGNSARIARMPASGFGQRRRARAASLRSPAESAPRRAPALGAASCGRAATFSLSWRMP